MSDKKNLHEKLCRLDFEMWKLKVNGEISKELYDKFKVLYDIVWNDESL